MIVDFGHVDTLELATPIQVMMVINGIGMICGKTIPFNHFLLEVK